jgi:hypothetical protein
MSAATEYVKKQLETKRDELRRHQDIVLRVQGAIAALESTLEQMSGSGKRTRQVAPPAGPPGLKEFMRELRQPKLHELAYTVLKEAGKPMPVDEIVSLMMVRGCRSTRESIRGALYRAAKEKKQLISVGKGVFGLLEWSTEPD